ncbi:hypothetical protein FQN52_009555 [Onygenales sp. PD_12]|nr:hypothetical protein FQN52_009555 [Onygenales sp. PD_12]KAK2784824.1 hypothetical protein FQN53_008217 [Emmonsiellopsis sp. PD_33]KAK2793291.1 hypothetical protein FQN51_001287 [Onygenales sp. PD_10]
MSPSASSSSSASGKSKVASTPASESKEKPTGSPTSSCNSKSASSSSSSGAPPISFEEISAMSYEALGEWCRELGISTYDYEPDTFDTLEDVQWEERLQRK